MILSSPETFTKDHYRKAHKMNSLIMNLIDFQKLLNNLPQNLVMESISSCQNY